LLSLAVAVFVSAHLVNVYAAIAQTGVLLLIGAGGFMIILALYARQGGGGRRVAR
jgi:hypothetical protein